LARNVAFISALMESGVEFEAVDLPAANKFNLHIMAAVAEHEAAAISTRTKDALACAKARGVKLGGYRWDIGTISSKGNAESVRVRRERADKWTSDVKQVIAVMRSEGANTLREIAEELNRGGVATVRGGKWSAAQVLRVMKHGE
jgi:DNA invertase Pin-like site-specific DNA recombinase